LMVVVTREENALVHRPEPIDTSKIQLDVQIMEMTERLAENVHEVWAQRRMAEGWRPEPRRDEAKKEHPSLVPYKDLPRADLPRADLSEADLSGANLAGADLSGVDLAEAILVGAILTGADLSTASLTQEELEQATVDENTRLPPDLNPLRTGE
jgi:hypothetical protein